MMSGYGNFAYYYDKLTDNVGYQKRCNYICSLLKENNIQNGILLDLACGTGTMTHLLAQKGYDMIGVDASEDMLSVALEKKLQYNNDAVFLCQKMQKLDLFGTIDAAICTLDSINHLTNEADVREAFRKAALFMNDGGIFIFDVNTPYKHENVLANNTFVYDLDEVYCVWQNTFHADNCSTTIQLDIFEQDEEEADVYYRQSEEFCERAYELKAIQEWLEQVRFEVIGIYNEMTKEPVNDKTERAVFVCKKHGTQFID